MEKIYLIYNSMRKISEEEIMAIVSKYSMLYEFRENEYSLYRLILNRRLVSLLDGLSRERRKRGTYKVKEKVEKEKDRTGPKPDGLYALWEPTFIDGKFHCGRCGQNNKMARLYQKLCNKCSYIFVRSKKTGEDCNLGNIKDQYCNININLEETIHVGLDADTELKKSLYKNGYGFIFK